MAVSTITLMELIYGAEKSQAPEHNLTDIEGFAARLEVLEYGSEAAKHTGQMRAELARIGQPIGPYDQMIAGHARSSGLIVVTNNLREFKRVPGLRVVDWVNCDPNRMTDFWKQKSGQIEEGMTKRWALWGVVCGTFGR
ncbi:MAG: tRNA(fMet)-specific endonuclease VapC [Acidithiobacillus sp.]